MTASTMEVDTAPVEEDPASEQENELEDETSMQIDKTNTNNNASSPTSAVANVYARDSSSSNSNNKQASESDGNQAVVFSPELLKMYYARLFPFELLHSWLAYDPCQQHPWIFAKREFSMTIEPTPGEEIYLRYQSFKDQQELTNAILKRRPTKIDLGAVFTLPPKDKKTVQKGKLLPVQRELVFDIDLTDYDDVRHCGCTGAKICPKCWTFMTMAVEVLETGLKDDFGFDHVAWFYSGRRGIHAWVCDETARTMTNEARTAVATYLEVGIATENNKDMELSLPLHPSLQRAHAILEPWFIEEILPASGHGLLATEERWTKDILGMIPEAGASVATLLEKKWREDGDSTTPAEKWDQLKRHIKVLIGRNSDTKSKTAKTMTTKDKDRLEHWPIEVVFRHTYPRLDINVSKTMNHLLKSPFCVHPKTGRVCVPIQPGDVRSFDPFAVPTLSQLMLELDDFESAKIESQQSQENDDGEEEKDHDNASSNNNNQKTRAPKHDWQKTSLKGYFDPFQHAFLEPMMKELRKKDKMAAEQEAAMRGDF